MKNKVDFLEEENLKLKNKLKEVEYKMNVENQKLKKTNSLSI
jgi:hypothetical protein